MIQKLFKSGEFAKICNTTKDTLFHYDDIGLLKPIKIASNGYRYYSTNQIFIFDMICVFKEVGLSLDEIKRYLEKRDAEKFIDILKLKDKKMREEIERLKNLRKLLKNTISITENAFNVEINKIVFMYKEEEYFIVTKVFENDDKKINNEESIYEAMSNHINYCDKNNFYYKFDFGEIIGEKSIIDKTFKTLYYSTKIDKKIKDKYLLIKPAGQYAVKYIRGSYDDLIKKYADFCEELEILGYRLFGNLYEEDILNYLSETDFNDYLMKIEIRVDKIN